MFQRALSLWKFLSKKTLAEAAFYTQGKWKLKSAKVDKVLIIIIFSIILSGNVSILQMQIYLEIVPADCPMLSKKYR